MRWKYCPLFVFLTMTGDISAQNDGGTHDASSGLMVQKCCPEGQVSFFDGSTGNNLVCVPRNPDLGPDYDWTGNFTTFDGDKMVIADKKPNFTATFGVPKCDEFRVLSPERNASENFAVFVDGNFAVESGHYINPGSYCVDRFVDDKENLTITHRGAIICGPAKWLPPAGVASRIDLLTGHVKYPKCCARNQVLNPNDMSCMDYDPSAISLYPVTNSADGTVAPDTIPDITPSVLPTFETHCSSVNPVARQAQEFHFLETGHLYFQHPTKVVSPDDFCLESALDFENNQTLAVVIVCEPSAERQRQKLLRKFDDQCEGQVCVLKCCPAGTSLMRMPNGHNTCAALPEGMSEWTPVFHDGTDFHEVIVEESAYKVIKGFSPICPDANAGVLAQLPSLVPEEAIYMMTTGNVYSKKYSRIIPAPEYCMDKFVLNATAHDITLICFPPQEKSDPMFAVYSACLIVSSVFLLLTLVISILLPDASRLGTWTLLCYVASLLVASLTLAGLQTFATAGGGFCVVVACVLYYSFLSAFMWLNVMSFDIWYTLRRNLPTTRSHMTLRFLKRCAYAFGAPAGMIIILLVFQLADGLPETFLTKSIDPAKRCWFKGDNAILFYFYGPIALLLLANMVFFGLTMHFLISHRRKTRNLNMEESAKKRFTLFIKLFVVMGVGWITEVISWKLGPEEIWYVTDIVNALTGILVFLVFICRRKTLEDLNKLIKERCLSRGNGGVGKSRSIAFTKSQETAKTRFSTQETSLTMANSSEGKVKTMGDEPSGVGADVADANFNGRRLSGSLRGDDADE